MRHEIKWGIIIGALSFIWLCLEYAIGLHTRHIDLLPYITLFSIIIPVICLLIAIKQKRNVINAGSITFVEAFKTGAIISAIAAIISLLSIFIYFKVINPGFTNFMTEHMVNNANRLGKSIPEAQQEAQRYFSLSNYMVQSFVSTLLIGLAISLVIAAFIKKKIVLWQD